MNTKQTVSFAQTPVSCQNCNLADLCLPYGLDLDEMAQLDTVIQHHAMLARGDHIFTTQDALKHIYAVKTGSIKTYQVTENGNEQVMGFYLPGELIGLDALHNNHHHCSAIALESTSLCALPMANLESISQLIPHLQHTLYRAMGKEIVQDQTMLLTLAKHTADERIAAFLLNISQRFHLRGFSATEFNLSMARHDIANYLGLAVETVSRTFSRFQEEKLLTVSRKYIKIHDLDKLRAIISSR